MFCRGHGVPERQLNLPVKRGGDKKGVMIAVKDAVMTMGRRRELRFVALLVHERPKLNPLKVLNAWNGLNVLNV